MKIPENLKHIIDSKYSSVDLTNDGKCSRCGNCCSNNLPLLKSDIERIKNYIDKFNVTPEIRGVPFNIVVDNVCPFLDSSNLCKIYPVRPKVCRLYKCNKLYSTMCMDWAGDIPDEYNVRSLFFK